MSPQSWQRTCLHLVPQGPEDGGRRLKRREKNRVAAQKSRKRQTQRADLLHEVQSLQFKSRDLILVLCYFVLRVSAVCSLSGEFLRAS